MESRTDARKKAAHRLPSTTVSLTVAWQSANGDPVTHDLDVSLAYDGIDGPLREIVFVGRGKIGQGLDLMLNDLGVKLSRAIQGRDPETGQ